MKDWLPPLLRCLECGATGLALEPGGFSCAACGAGYPTREGVADFLAEPHPVVAREIAAVAALDSDDPAAHERVRRLLRDLDRGDAGPDDPRLAELPSFREHFDTRRRVRRMLRSLGVEGDTVVVELGADHCLVSSQLLDAGCRVVAVDITSHLRLAPRAGDDRFARLCADMNRLPLADGTAGLVWATACVHHSWSLPKTFAEARRVLAPGGRFVLLNEPMPAWPRYLLSGLGLAFGREERALGINENLHVRARWLRTARRAGFRPRLVFPELGASRRERWDRLPGPLKRRLQVSIHMVAELGA